MPALVPHVPVDLDELFQDRSAAPCTLSRESRRVVVVAVDIPIVFIVRIMWPKQGRAYRASEMLHMILLVWKRLSSSHGSTGAWIRYGHTAGGDITSPQCHTAFSADEIQTPEVIPLAQWVLLSVWTFDREKLGGYHVPTILRQRDTIVHHRDVKSAKRRRTMHLKQLR